MGRRRAEWSASGKRERPTTKTKNNIHLQINTIYTTVIMAKNEVAASEKENDNDIIIIIISTKLKGKARICTI